MTYRFLTLILLGLSALPVAAQSARPRVVAATTSSTLPDPQKPGHYALDKLYDGDPRTAWVEGKADDGVGEWIDLTIDPPASANELRVMPGYFVPKVWDENNRVKAARIDITDATGSTRSITASFADVMEPQAVVLDAKGSVAVRRVKLTITAVYRGTVYRDTPVADLGFYWGGHRLPLWDSPELKSSPAAGASMSRSTQVDDGLASFGEDGFYEDTWSAFGEEKHGLRDIGVWRWDGGSRSVTVTVFYRSWVRGVGKSHVPESDGPGPVAPVWESYANEHVWVAESVKRSWWSLASSFSSWPFADGGSMWRNKGPFAPPPFERPEGLSTTVWGDGKGEYRSLGQGEVADVYDRIGGALLDHLVPGQALNVVALSERRVSETDTRVWGIVRNDLYPEWQAWAALPGVWGGK